jgi:hypothetical protein
MSSGVEIYFDDALTADQRAHAEQSVVAIVEDKRAQATAERARSAELERPEDFLPPQPGHGLGVHTITVSPEDRPVMRASGVPVDLNRRPAGGGPRFDQFERCVRAGRPEVGDGPRGAIQEATRSSIWLIADEAPSTTPMSSTCWSASADSKVLT